MPRTGDGKSPPVVRTKQTGPYVAEVGHRGTDAAPYILSSWSRCPEVLPRISDLWFDADPVINGGSNALLAAEVSLGGLN